MDHDPTQFTLVLHAVDTRDGSFLSHLQRRKFGGRCQRNIPRE